MVNLDVYISTTCNLRCPFCAVDKQAPEELSFEQIEKIVDWTQRNEVGQFQIFGGEPFMFLDKVRAFDDVRCESFTLPTNGTAFSRKAWEFIEEHPKYRLFMAMDGIPHAHRMARPSQPRRKTIERFLALPNPVGANFAITRDNVPYLADGLRYLVELGFDVIHTNFVREKPYWPAHLDIWREQLRIASDYLSDKNVYTTLFELRNETGKFYCNLGEIPLSVGPDGGVYPCIAFAGFTPDMRSGTGNFLPSVSGKPANIRLGDNLDSYKPFQFAYTKMCRECPVQNECWVCPASSYLLTGDLHDIPQWFCRAMFIRSDAMNVYAEKRRATLELPERSAVASQYAGW